MQASQAVTTWLEYHKSNSKQNTLRAYQAVLSDFSRDFGEKEINEIASADILSFLNLNSEVESERTPVSLSNSINYHAKIQLCRS